MPATCVHVLQAARDEAAELSSQVQELQQRAAALQGDVARAASGRHEQQRRVAELQQALQAARQEAADASQLREQVAVQQVMRDVTSKNLQVGDGPGAAAGPPEGMLYAAHVCRLDGQQHRLDGASSAFTLQTCLVALPDTHPQQLHKVCPLNLCCSVHGKTACSVCSLLATSQPEVASTVPTDATGHQLRLGGPAAADGRGGPAQ